MGNNTFISAPHAPASKPSHYLCSTKCSSGYCILGIAYMLCLSIKDFKKIKLINFSQDSRTQLLHMLYHRSLTSHSSINLSSLQYRWSGNKRSFASKLMRACGERNWQTARDRSKHLRRFVTMVTKNNIPVFPATGIDDQVCCMQPQVYIWIYVKGLC